MRQPLSSVQQLLLKAAHLNLLRCLLITLSAVGLTAGTASTEEQPLLLSLQLLPSNPLAEAACEAANPLQTLQLPVHVQPSTAPASIVFVIVNDELPIVVSYTCFCMLCLCTKSCLQTE